MKSVDKPEEPARRVSAIVRDAYVFEEGPVEGVDRSKPGICWWDPDTEKSSQLRDYSFDSSIHGLKYTSQPSRHLAERIFWVVVILVALVILVWLLILLWNDYSNPKLVMTMDTQITESRNIPFPRVTVCKANGAIEMPAKRGVNKTNGGGRSQNLALLETVSCNTEILGRINNTNAQEKVCSEILQDCKVGSHSINCGLAFQPIISEQETHRCCTLTVNPANYTQNKEKIFQKYSKINPRRMVSDIIQQYTTNPIEVTFQILMKPQSKRCVNSSSQDFSVFIGRVNSEPPETFEDDRLALQPNSELQVQVIPSISKIEEDLRNIDAGSRKCYFPDEYKLTDFKDYSERNCLKECVRANLEGSCGCKPTTTNQNKTTTAQLCTEVQAPCVDRMIEKLQNHKKQICQHCLPLCNEIHYSLLTTSNSMATNNLSYVRIFFSSNPVYANVLSATPQHSLIFYIALSGGLLSLCLGCSGISIIEIIYYCTLRVFCVRRRRKTKWTIAAEKLQRAMNKIKSKNNRFRNISKQATGSIPDVKVQNYIEEDISDLHIINVES